MVWDERVATTERCPPGECREACYRLFGGQRSVVAMCVGRACGNDRALPSSRIPRSLLSAFLEGNAPSLPCVWDECVATTERCPPAEYLGACYRLFWRATLRRCHVCGTSVWQRQSVALQPNTAKLTPAFLEGNAPSLPWCGTSVWQRQSVALQVNTAKLTPGLFEGNAPSLPCVWDECVATTERCPPGEYREACSGFLEGNAPSLPWCVGRACGNDRALPSSRIPRSLLSAFLEGNAPSLPWCVGRVCGNDRALPSR